MEKYGFVYIWFDRKYSRYYIGCHWGFEDDGYICSSPWMRQAYKHRPEDFKRKILNRVYERSELFKKEEKWLSLIKDEELRVRYYNLNKWAGSHWTLNEDHRNTRQKISDAGKGRVVSEETKKKKSETAKKVDTAKSLREWMAIPENKEVMRNRRLGKSRPGDPMKFKHTEETKQKIGNANKGNTCWATGKKMSDESKEKNRQAHLGIKHGPPSEETKRKIAESNSKTKKGKYFWFNDGTIQTYARECPNGWVRGRLPMTWINRDKRTGRLVGSND